MYHSRDPSEGNNETIGNCNLKDKVVVWGQYRKRRGSRRSSDRELDSLACKTEIPGAVENIITRKAFKANTTKAKSITKKILQTKGKKYWKYWPWRNTAILRKVFWWTARDNPERYCGRFWVHCFSKKFERMAREAMDICLCVLKEINKSRFDSYSVRNSVLQISHITFRDCRVHMFSDNLSRNSCMWPKRMSNTWKPKKSRLQNEILTASIAQEIEEDGNKNRRQKGSGERQWWTRERRKGEEGIRT